MPPNCLCPFHVFVSQLPSISTYAMNFETVRDREVMFSILKYIHFTTKAFSKSDLKPFVSCGDVGVKLRMSPPYSQRIIKGD